ncbi:hypothetical protein HK102_005145 [Quaeritorhiza haematococci]|nr:hypothetical protein HK102_005145 [Quaeritorhiza haematococci]
MSKPKSPPPENCFATRSVSPGLWAALPALEALAKQQQQQEETQRHGQEDQPSCDEYDKNTQQWAGAAATRRLSLVMEAHSAHETNREAISAGFAKKCEDGRKGRTKKHRRRRASSGSIVIQQQHHSSSPVLVAPARLSLTALDTVQLTPGRPMLTRPITPEEPAQQEPVLELESFPPLSPTASTVVSSTTITSAVSTSTVATQRTAPISAAPTISIHIPPRKSPSIFRWASSYLSSWGSSLSRSVAGISASTSSRNAAKAQTRESQRAVAHTSTLTSPTSTLATTASSTPTSSLTSSSPTADHRVFHLHHHPQRFVPPPSTPSRSQSSSHLAALHASTHASNRPSSRSPSPSPASKLYTWGRSHYTVFPIPAVAAAAGGTEAVDNSDTCSEAFTYVTPDDTAAVHITHLTHMNSQYQLMT